MIIQEVLSKIEGAQAPVIKVLQNNALGKVLVLGLKKGVALKEHQTAIPARLIVMEGEVNYKQEGKTIALNRFSDLEIPVNIMHSVEGAADSICLLILG